MVQSGGGPPKEGRGWRGARCRLWVSVWTAQGSVLVGCGLAQPQRSCGVLQGHVERSHTFPPLLGGVGAL